MLFAASSCSRLNESGSNGANDESGPALQFEFVPLGEFWNPEFEGLLVKPKGTPSGIFYLKKIHNGEMAELARLEFKEMSEEGTLGFKSNNSEIEILIDLKATQGILDTTTRTVPKNQKHIFYVFLRFY